MRPLTIVLACLAISACSSPPRPLSPDGASRIPVNTPQSIDRYRSQPATAPQQAADIHQRIAALEREVSRLQQQLSPTVPTGPAQQPSISPTSAIDGVIVEQRAGAMLFRFSQAYGKAHCAAGPALRTALTNAAALSERIEISGHTDAVIGDMANRRLAAQRARCAYTLLLATGIPAAKLHSSYHASGAFIATYLTAEGRAQNRRIDIEMLGARITAAPQPHPPSRSATP